MSEIIIGTVAGKKWISTDNGDGTHSLVCPVKDDVFKKSYVVNKAT